MKIAMFGHKRIPSREGGVEIVVSELSTRMAARGHVLTCYNRRGHSIAGRAYDSARRSEYCGVRLKNVLTVDKKGLAAVSSSIAASFCAAFGPYDVVHIHAEGPAFLCWLPRLCGKKVVVTVHGLDHQRAKWGRFASAYIMAGEKAAVRFAHEIIVLSRGVQDYFNRQYGRRTVLIPNGVTKPELQPADWICRQFGLQKDGYLLFLGRLVPEKGIHYLIEAWQKTDRSKQLVIAGSASDTDAYAERLRQLAGGDPNLIFTGFVQGKELAELYSNAYLYCLPSDLEGMPLSLLEAMSYGNCCLTSDIPECADVLEDCGITFPRGNVDALAETLRRLCADRAAVQSYKDRAAEFICSRYSWDDVAEKTLELYRSE